MHNLLPAHFNRLIPSVIKRENRNIPYRVDRSVGYYSDCAGDVLQEEGLLAKEVKLVGWGLVGGVDLVVAGQALAESCDDQYRK